MPVLIWQCSAQPSLSNHHWLSNWCQGKGDPSLYMMEKPDVIHATAKTVVAGLQISVENLSMTINKTAYNRQHGSALTQSVSAAASEQVKLTAPTSLLPYTLYNRSLQYINQTSEKIKISCVIFNSLTRGRSELKSDNLSQIKNIIA